MSYFASALPGILTATLGEPLEYLRGGEVYQIDGIPSKRLGEDSSQGESIYLDELSLAIDTADIKGEPSSGDQVRFRDKLYDIQYTTTYANGLAKIFLVEAIDAPNS